MGQKLGPQNLTRKEIYGQGQHGRKIHTSENYHDSMRRRDIPELAEDNTQGDPKYTELSNIYCLREGFRDSSIVTGYLTAAVAVPIAPTWLTAAFRGLVLGAVPPETTAYGMDRGG